MELRYKRKCFKVRYGSKGAAKKALIRTNQHKNNTKRVKNCYYCNECQGWHLTSMEKQKSRAISRKLKRG